MKTITKHFRRISGRFASPSAAPRDRQSGFTLLLAALIASIVLAVGASIFNIAHKQVALSSIGRESEFAFYAADTAAECGLYWDSRYQYFAQTTPPNVSPTCDGQPVAISPALSGQAYPYTVGFQFAPNGRCAKVSVTKYLDPVSGGVKTIIHADGFNVPCETVSLSELALERSVELNY